MERTDEGKKKVLIDRLKCVKAMEFLARQINDEEVFDGWLMMGVADGDIEYGDLNIDETNLDADTNAEAMWWAEDEENFCDLMTQFLICMKNAWKSGGLYCGDVTSRELSDYRKGE